MHTSASDSPWSWSLRASSFSCASEARDCQNRRQRSRTATSTAATSAPRPYQTAIATTNRKQKRCRQAGKHRETSHATRASAVDVDDGGQLKLGSPPRPPPTPTDRRRQENPGRRWHSAAAKWAREGAWEERGGQCAYVAAPVQDRPSSAARNFRNFSPPGSWRTPCPACGGRRRPCRSSTWNKLIRVAQIRWYRIRVE